MLSLASTPDCESVEDAPKSEDRARRAHEVAFRRWSIPEEDEIATANGDVAPSFRVCTPAEIARTPLRPSNRPMAQRSLGDELVELADRARAAGPRALAKWAAIGVFGGAAVLGLLLLLANLSDDTRTASSSAQTRGALVLGDAVPAEAAPAKAEAASAPSSEDDGDAVDFEIPDTPGAAAGAEVRRVGAGRAARGAPAPRKRQQVRIIRNAPF